MFRRVFNARTGWRLLLVVVGAVFTLWAAPAAAQTCSFSVSNISFGSVSPVAGGATVDSTGVLNITCSNLGLLHIAPVTITVCPNLDAGSGGSTSTSRLLTGPGATTPFQLYQDAGRTTPWGAASFLAFNSVPTITLTSDNTGAIHANQTVYARMTNQSASPAGTYASSFSGESFYWGLNIASCAGVTLGAIATPPAFTVSANVIVDCLLTAQALNFGTAGLLTTGVAAQTSLSVACTNGSPYSIALSAGQTGSGPTTRLMTAGAGSIQYGLYKDAALTLPWGDAGAGAATLVSATGTGAPQALTVYGYVPPQSTPAPGSYADTVVITVSY
jgi:spore coat protein U-like protein